MAALKVVLEELVNKVQTALVKQLRLEVQKLEDDISDIIDKAVRTALANLGLLNIEPPGQRPIPPHIKFR